MIARAIVLCYFLACFCLPRAASLTPLDSPNPTGGPEGLRGVPWTHDVVLEFIHATEQLISTESAAEKPPQDLDAETVEVPAAALRQQN